MGSHSSLWVVEFKVAPALSLLESPGGTHLYYLGVKFSPQGSKR